MTDEKEFNSVLRKNEAQLGEYVNEISDVNAISIEVLDTTAMTIQE